MVCVALSTVIVDSMTFCDEDGHALDGRIVQRSNVDVKDVPKVACQKLMLNRRDGLCSERKIIAMRVTTLLFLSQR